MKRFVPLFILMTMMAMLFWLISPDTTKEIPYSEAITHIQAGEVASVEIASEMVTLTPTSDYRLARSLDKRFRWKAVRAGELEYLETLLTQHKVSYEAEESSWFAQNFLMLFWIAMIGLLIFRPRGSKGGISGIFSFTDHKGRRAQNVKTTFRDVAGYDHVKEPLQEVVAFLKDPERFSRLGAKLPKGVLLHGPPGTGKTLMARAVAGEAGVPFIHISGSDFIEMFVGVGAGRVSSLFGEAKSVAPCIIFIDEIDAVGGHRSGRGGGDSERDQTINKLLAEMDGFEENAGIVVIAATNRPDTLDEALQRRFGRKVFVGLPSVSVRQMILEVHSRNKTTNGIDFDRVAALTPGMSGAAMEGIFNEAALLATREDAEHITTDHLVRAIELVVVGQKDLARRLSEADRRVVAVHEAGHAIVSAALHGFQRVSRISIIPTTSGALGYNLNTPEDEDDSHLHHREELLNNVAHLLGGRAAEEVMEGKVSTGASDDLRRANAILYRMITVYGLSEKLAHRALHDGETEWSERTAALVDEEIEQLLVSCYTRTKALIEHNRPLAGRIAGELINHEELSGSDLTALLRQVEDPTIK